MFSFLSWIQKLQVKNSYNNSKKINYHSLDLDLYRIFPLGSHINHATPQEQQTCTTGKVTLSYHYTVFLYITNGLYTIFFASTQGRSSCDIVFPVRPGTLPKRPISNPHPFTLIYICANLLHFLIYEQYIIHHFIIAWKYLTRQKK